MLADPPDLSDLAVEVRRFRSAAEALRRQDYFDESPFAPDRPALLIWQSPAALLAAPGDGRLPQFDATARACAAAGWPVAIRRGGGRICPISPGTLQIAISRPVVSGVTIESAYDEMARLIEALLARVGLRGERGECAHAFCPGRYDIAVAGRKVAGLAQAWRRNAGEMTAITGASLIIDAEAGMLADAANRFYRDISGAPACDPAAIGSLSGLAAETVTVADAVRILRDLRGRGAGV